MGGGKEYEWGETFNQKYANFDTFTPYNLQLFPKNNFPESEK